jgi:hypothetical protein
LAAQHGGQMSLEQVIRYERVKIAFLTGWTLEYVDSLGLSDRRDVLEIYDVEGAITADRRAQAAAKARRKGRRR